MTSAEDRTFIVNSWRWLDILEAVATFKKDLLPLDPFHHIQPLLYIPITLEYTDMTKENFASCYISNISMRNDDYD